SYVYENVFTCLIVNDESETFRLVEKFYFTSLHKKNVKNINTIQTKVFQAPKCRKNSIVCKTFEIINQLF
ncbi:MAG: hypothetical protein RL045_1426, partial [Bacteroidota bacterium]